jgi:hypothetical protein
MNFYTTESNNKKAYDAQREAQWISYAPFIFQISRTVINTGILKLIKDSKKEGIRIETIAAKLNMTVYSVRVLIHACLGIGLVCKNDDGQYFLTKTGWFLLCDRAVKVTMDFTNDVCYNGLFYLEDSIINGKPEGLKVFGEWPNIYEGLSRLPENVQTSWFNLDHYYSDEAFPVAIPHILNLNPSKIIDIGGNTGKFAKKLIESNSNVTVTILDLPRQIALAKQNLATFKQNEQIHFHPIDLLDENQKIPKGHDVIWMSQFLDCFSENQIISILKRCSEAIDSNGRIVIQECFWDKQISETTAFSMQQFSLYFTAMANGNSQLYDYDTFKKCIDAAGLIIENEYHHPRISNSLLFCKKL